MLPTIAFAHANGFPAGVYRQLFETWRAAGAAVFAPDKLGHDPRFPVTSNWPHLRDELLDFIEREVPEPAWLVGHSMGGYVSLLAALRRPQRVRGVVLLDAPVVAGWRAGLLRLSKATGVGERFSPAHVSRRRREHWPSREAALRHFAAKQAFARWAPGVLDDYVASGLESAPEGMRLAFRRETETDIYRGVPHHLARLLRVHPLARPVAFIGGSHSRELRQVGVAATRRVVGSRFELIEGGHLFPMERPVETAERVLAQIAAIERGEARPPDTPSL